MSAILAGYRKQGLSFECNCRASNCSVASDGGDNPGKGIPYIFREVQDVYGRGQSWKSGAVLWDRNGFVRDSSYDSLLYALSILG